MSWTFSVNEMCRSGTNTHTFLLVFFVVLHDERNRVGKRNYLASTKWLYLAWEDTTKETGHPFHSVCQLLAPPKSLFSRRKQWLYVAREVRLFRFMSHKKENYSGWRGMPLCDEDSGGYYTCLFSTSRHIVRTTTAVVKLRLCFPGLIWT